MTADLYLVRLTARQAELATVGARLLAPMADVTAEEVAELVDAFDQARPMGDAPRHLHTWLPYTDSAGIVTQRCGCGATWLRTDEQVGVGT